MTGDGRADHFCWGSNGGVWSDSDRGQDYCKKADYAKNIPNCVGTECWVASDESVAFGEYPSGGGTECCGDDSGENYVTAGVGPDRCCNNDNDCVDAGGSCRSESTESGFCYNGIDDDCDGDIDFADSDCCSGLGAFCSSDSQCCNGVPCDNPVENAGNKCGCPTDYTWIGGTCVYGPITCGGSYPSYICDFAPYLDSANCIRGFEDCCIASSYGGKDYYGWDAIVVLTV